MTPSSLIGHVLQLLEHIDSENLPPDRLTADFFRSKKYLGPRERRFIADTVFGIVRHRKFIKTLLKQFIKEHPASGGLEGPHVRYLTQFTIYINTLDERSQVPPLYWKTHFPKIDLEMFVDWIKKNRTLDFLPKDNVAWLSVKYSFQEWMVQRWINQLGDDVEKLLSALNIPAPTTLRINSRKTNREECQARLHDEGIETEKTLLSQVGLKANKRFNMQSSKTFQDGWFEVQDEGSQLISMIANPKPGYTVVDGCAGAGGKSLHMSDLMHNEGKTYAIDVEGSRLRELKLRANRAGVSIIETVLQKNLDPDTLIEKADLVFVDVPCSGIGTIKRNPGLKWSVTESSVLQYSKKQSEILAFNSSFVKVGGTLVYVTCSLFDEENDNVIANFLNTHPNFQLIYPADHLSTLGLKSDKASITLYPHRYNTDGFFIAVMRRI